VKASILKYLNGLDTRNLEKIASKTGIEVDWINVGGTDTKGALMERVREWIIEEMDRYFNESIDNVVDSKIQKLAVGFLQRIRKEIKSAKDQVLDEVRSDQTMGCNPSQQTHQSDVAPYDEHSYKTSIHNVILFPTYEVVSPDHVSSADATFTHAHNSSREEMLGMDEIIRKEILAVVMGRGDDDFIESDEVDGTDRADGMEAEEGDDATIENGVIGGAGVEDPRSSKSDCGESYVLSRKAEFESMMSKGLANQEYLHKDLSVVFEKNAHRNQVVRRMRENRLEETKEELEANVNKLVWDIQDLAEEEGSLRDELKAARYTCGNDTMKISSLNKDLADIKQVNMEKESEKHDYLTSLNTEKSIQESELTTDQSTINELQAEIDELEECFWEIDSFLSGKSEINVRLKKLSTEKNHHKTKLCSLKTTDEKEMLESLKNEKENFDTTFKEHEDFVSLKKKMTMEKASSKSKSKKVKTSRKRNSDL